MSLLPALFRRDDADFQPLGKPLRLAAPEPAPTKEQCFETGDWLPPGASTPPPERAAWPVDGHDRHPDRQSVLQEVEAWAYEVARRTFGIPQPTFGDTAYLAAQNLGLRELSDAMLAAFVRTGRDGSVKRLFSEYGTNNIYGVAPERRAEIINKLNAL